MDSMIIGPCAGGMTAREIRHHTGGSTIGAGPGAGGRSRRSPTRCAGAVMEWQRRPPGGLLPGDPPRRDPRRWSAPTTGCRGRPNPHRRGRGAWTASSTWLKDLDPGRGGGLLEGRRVCARSGQQGGARGVLIVCCDGPAGLPEAARGGPGPTPWSPARVVHPGPRHPCGSSPTGTARGSPPPGARACTAPDEEAARRAPGAFRQSDPGPRAPADGGDVGEGLGEEHRLPGLPPGPAPGHLCTTNAVRVAQPPNRAVRREARPLSPPTRRRPELLWPAGLQHPRGRRAAERAKEKNTPAHSRRANGWTRRRGGSPPTGAHRPARRRPARRRPPRPNQPPSLTEPAYTETLTGSQ